MLCELLDLTKRLYILDLNYQYVKWLDNEEMYSVRNVPTIIFLKTWVRRKKMFSIHQTGLS